MKLYKIRIIKQDERGIIYDCGKSRFISRKKNTVSANHKHKDSEIGYLVKGEVELTIGNETKIIKAPIRFKMGANIYHKLVALSDIEIVIERNY
ncbi:MAG: cupin domain-containing protein [Candidatus Micrarchaeota archaeon]